MKIEGKLEKVFLRCHPPLNGNVQNGLSRPSNCYHRPMDSLQVERYGLVGPKIALRRLFPRYKARFYHRAYSGEDEHRFRRNVNT